MIRIVLADDHHIVRKGLLALLGNEKDFEIVGEASNGPQTLELARHLHPDILILDLMMPGMNGLEVAAQLTRDYPQIRIIILSMQCNDAYVYEALRSGAMGYVLKDNTAEELITAIRQVRNGLSYFSSSLHIQSKEMYDDIPETESVDPLEQLTSREKEVLYLAIKGLCNADIASRLGISQRTVETHCTNFMHKLGLSSRSRLIQYAIQHGIASKNNISIENTGNRQPGTS